MQPQPRLMWLDLFLAVNLRRFSNGLLMPKIPLAIPGQEKIDLIVILTSFAALKVYLT
jgi:hypothetical protein